MAGDGSVLVADSGNNRVQRFGDFNATLTPPAFGAVALGASATQTLTLTNGGLTDLPLDAISVSGPDAGQFVRTGGSCTSATTLADGQACTIQITITPTRTGPLSASVGVDASMGAWSGTYTTALTATATPPPPPPLVPALGAPSIGALSPTSGPTRGGLQVTITGADFTDATQVWFGDTPAANVQVERYDRLVATTPSHTAGPVLVTIETPAGTSPPFVYTYRADDPAPSQAQETSPPPPSATTGCTVPNLHGRTIAAARQLLQAGGCTLGHVHRTASRRGAPTPRVIRQSPAATTLRPVGTPVTVTTRTHR